MYQIKVNQKFNFKTDNKNGEIFLDDDLINIDFKRIDDKRFHLIYKHQSFLAELVNIDEAEKKMVIKVNQNNYNLDIRDQFDELLKNLGLENLNSVKIKEIKAPMPGLVLKIIAKEGEDVKKGDNLLILEAMKMENMIKAPADIKIKKIQIKEGDKVEKNQIMLILD
nr:acetyl-CoA carboxylase biotin carboxyl carrier protein subunit [Pseudopedobacter sp.]